MNVVRELSKVAMFIVLWSMPLLIARLFGSQWYLCLLVVSLIGTFILFTHFEDIEKIAHYGKTE